MLRITSLPFPEKILCILCIHVNQNLFRASTKPLAAEFCKRFLNCFILSQLLVALNNRGAKMK